MSLLKKLFLATAATAALAFPLTNVFPAVAQVATYDEAESSVAGPGTNDTFGTAELANIDANDLPLAITGFKGFTASPAGDTDFFSFFVPENSILSLSGDTAVFGVNFNLGLFDSSGTQVVFSPVGDTDNAESFSYIVAPGSGGLFAASVTGTGPNSGTFGYDLFISAEPVPAPAPILGLMAFGALGGANAFRRKQKQAVLASK